jgi:uncharacterized membrane protein YbhN (UPF0104 family)
VTLVVYLFYQTDLNEFLSLREQILPRYLIATFALYLVLTLLKALTYQVLLQQNIQYWRVLNVVVLQNAISNFLANGAGIVSYFTMLKVEENVTLGRSGLVFIIMKLGDLFSVWLVMLVCGLLYWDQISSFHQMFAVIESTVALGFALFFSLLVFRSAFLLRMQRWMVHFDLTRFSLLRSLAHWLEAFSEMKPAFVQVTVFKAFALSLIYYLFTLAWQVTSLYAFDFQAQTWVIVFVSGILQLFSLLPITIFGGVGVTEATSLYLYPLLGVDFQGLAAILLGWRILYYMTNLFVLIYLPVYTFFIEPHMRAQVSDIDE